MILEVLPKDYVFVATTGFTGRILLKCRINKGQNVTNDFLVVGGMGHANQIAAGLALKMLGKSRRIVCFDGDGAILMHLGGLLKSSKYENFIHVLLNNGCHESVGKQSTGALGINFANIAKELGYIHTYIIRNLEEIETIFSQFSSLQGSIFVEIKCKIGEEIELPRPSFNSKTARHKFQEFLRK